MDLLPQIIFDTPGLVLEPPLPVENLLEGVKEQMGVYRSTDNIDYYFKDSAAQPAPEALYDEVAAKYKGAIVALAD